MKFKNYYLTESKISKAIKIVSKSDSRFVHISTNLFDPYSRPLSRGEYNVSVTWYEGVDVPSICVFDPKCIVNWKKIKLKTFIPKIISKHFDLE